MFRKMRRSDRLTSTERAYQILKDSAYGVFTLNGDDGYPYGVPVRCPVNHVVMDDNIYFHAANEGKKYDSLLINNNCGFTSVEYHQVVPEMITTKYASVICMGKATLVHGDEKLKALVEIMKIYANDHLDSGMDKITKSIEKLSVVKIDIEHISGKENN